MGLDHADLRHYPRQAFLDVQIRQGGNIGVVELVPNIRARSILGRSTGTSLDQPAQGQVASGQREHRIDLAVRTAVEKQSHTTPIPGEPDMVPLTAAQRRLRGQDVDSIASHHDMAIAAACHKHGTARHCCPAREEVTEDTGIHRFGLGPQGTLQPFCICETSSSARSVRTKPGICWPPVPQSKARSTFRGRPCHPAANRRLAASRQLCSDRQSHRCRYRPIDASTHWRGAC